MLESTKNKLGWIKKRVELSDTQEEYVGFMVDQQERLINLLSAHIYAARGSLSMDDEPNVQYFLDEAIKDIEKNK